MAGFDQKDTANYSGDFFLVSICSLFYAVFLIEINKKSGKTFSLLVEVIWEKRENHFPSKK